MAFSKWFWDEFPKRCTAAWWVFMITLLVVTAFWRDPVYNWFAGKPVVLFLSFLALLILVTIGNYIPGIPNMPLPLLTGWALAAGLDLYISMMLGVLIFFFGAVGSKLIYARAYREGASLVQRWHLDKSERFQEAITAFRTVPSVIFKSRVGKFAAYCGHINIVAGIEKYPNDTFSNSIVSGHCVWTCQYITIGFLIGLLLPYIGKLVH